MFCVNHHASQLPPLTERKHPMPETHIPDTDYAALVAALLNVPPCPMTGRVTENEIKIVLGEIGDVWPESIRADAGRAAIVDAGR